MGLIGSSYFIASEAASLAVLSAAGTTFEADAAAAAVGLAAASGPSSNLMSAQGTTYAANAASQALLAAGGSATAAMAVTTAVLALVGSSYLTAANAAYSAAIGVPLTTVAQAAAAQSSVLASFSCGLYILNRFRSVDEWQSLEILHS